jgi:ribosomal protein S18 acetylase RimI-like enzyme
MNASPASRPIEIIEATLEHLDLIAPLFDAYRQFYKQPADLLGAQAFIRERMELNESIIFLAIDGTDPQGFTQLYPSFSSESMQRLWILNDLFVAPSARRFGVAKALMERARQLAVETGAKGLVLETAVTNLPAQALYESLGWRRDAEFYRYYLSV